MKFTLSWLKEHLETSASFDEISKVLTDIGLEVEKIENPSEKLQDFSVAEITEAKQHPNADKLRVCTVNTGKEKLQIVCGAANARAGIKVVLAPIGAKVPANGMEIKKVAIRGVESNGMLCSAEELAMDDGSDGIIELPENYKVGERFAEAANLDDPIIEIAITPNRGDCLGVRGIARDLAAAGLGKLKELKIPKAKGTFKSSINVSIEDKSCHQFVGRYIKGVKNPESPDWMQSRLKAIGLRPISALVDITNYIAYDLARPLHVYDADKLDGNILVRKAKKGEKVTVLNDKQYSLDESIGVISDDKSPVAIAGVIGEKNSGCSESTKNVLLEVALFDPISVAMSGRKLQIDSDSRYRFERSVDPDFLEDAAEITTKMILDICGGEVSELLIAGDHKKSEREIEFNLNKIKTLGGVDIPEQEIKSILEKLGFTVKKGKNGFSIKVPSWRNDVTQETDLIEEVLRIYGYSNIPMQPINNSFIGKAALTPEQTLIARIRRNLASRQMTEIVSFSFMDSKTASLFHEANDNLKLLNPISSELDILRSTIIPNLLAAIKNNSNRGYENLALFEVGPVFSDKEKIQSINISCVRSGKFAEKTVHGSARPVDFFDSKADLISCLPGINPDSLTYSKEAPQWYHPGKSASVSLGKQTVAYVGEINPQILAELGIEIPVTAFEVFPENIPPAKNKTKSRFEASNFQHVDRDFAFILDDKVTASELVKTVSAVNKNLIEKVNIFDLFKGKNVPEGKKSVAFSIRLQPKDRTLQQSEIDEISKKIIEEVQSKLDGSIRN